MTIASNLGFPPLGAARELKRATEGYWAGKLSAQQLLATGAELRQRHWELQRAIGIDRIPANDFSFYDRMLDTCALVGAVPPRYGGVEHTVIKREIVCVNAIEFSCYNRQISHS